MLALLLVSWSPVLAQDSRATTHAATMDKLLLLIKQRLDISVEVAKTKWVKHLPIDDPSREKVILEALDKQAASYDLPADFAHKFFVGQIEASKQVQYDLHGGWVKKAPTLGKVLDLTHDIRPRLDKLTPQLMQALRDAYPILKAEGGRVLLETRAAPTLSSFPQTARQVALKPLYDISK